MLNVNKCTKTKPKATLIFENCSFVCAYHCAQLSNTTQNSSDNFPSYPPDNRRSSDDVYWCGWMGVFACLVIQYLSRNMTDMQLSQQQQLRQQMSAGLFEMSSSLSRPPVVRSTHHFSTYSSSVGGTSASKDENGQMDV